MPKIPEGEIEVIFSRSSGHGGQNVNKTSTRVQVKWNIYRSRVLSNEERERIKLTLKNHLSWSGDLLVTASDERSQIANRIKATQRLQQMVDRALRRQKKRISTKPSRNSVLKRLEKKRKVSELKHSRKTLFD